MVGVEENKSLFPCSQDSASTYSFAAMMCSPCGSIGVYSHDSHFEGNTGIGEQNCISIDL